MMWVNKYLCLQNSDYTRNIPTVISIIHNNKTYSINVYYKIMFTFIKVQAKKYFVSAVQENTWMVEMMVAPAACCYTTLIACMYFTFASSCPTFFYYSNTSHHCECGVNVGGVQCNQQGAEVMSHYCVSTAEQEGQYYVGRCPFAHTAMNHTNRMLSELPSDPDQLNDVMCGPYNRRGLLCGQCISGYGPGVNHFNLKCANCSNIPTPLAVGLYLLVELVPGTFFSSVLSSFTSISQLALYWDMCFFVR